MERTDFFEMLPTTYTTSQHNSPKDYNLHVFQTLSTFIGNNEHDKVMATSEHRKALTLPGPNTFLLLFFKT